MSDTRWEPIEESSFMEAGSTFWKPPFGYVGTAEDYYTTRGIPVDQYERYYNNVIAIKQYIYSEYDMKVFTLKNHI